MFTKPELRFMKFIDKERLQKHISKDDRLYKEAFSAAKRRCEIVMSSDNWEYELCKRLSNILDRNFKGYPQKIYDLEEKGLIMIKLNLK